MTDLIGKNVSLDLNVLYHSQTTKFGRKVDRDYYDGRQSYDCKETYLTYDGLLIQHGTTEQCYGEQDYYDLIEDSTGLYLCCDGETVKVVKIDGNQITLLNEDVETSRGTRCKTFILSREEFDIATNGKYKED